MNPYRDALTRLQKLGNGAKWVEGDRSAVRDALPAIRAKADEHDAWSASLAMAYKEHVAMYAGQCKVCAVPTPCPFVIRMERDEP